MTIHERIEVLETKEPGREAFVVLFRAAGTAQPFDIDAVVDDNGNAQIDMSEASWGRGHRDFPSTGDYGHGIDT
jgi:hypothetical protein